MNEITDKNTEKMCLNKRLYITQEEAQRVLNICEKRRKVELRIYKCPICKGYHLTSKEEKMADIVLESPKNETETIKGYLAINENKEVFYIPEGNSPELTVMRVLQGQKFKIIDLAKINDEALKYLQKI